MEKVHKMLSMRILFYQWLHQTINQIVHKHFQNNRKTWQLPWYSHLFVFLASFSWVSQLMFPGIFDIWSLVEMTVYHEYLNISCVSSYHRIHKRLNLHLHFLPRCQKGILRCYLRFWQLQCRNTGLWSFSC